MPLFRMGDSGRRTLVLPLATLPIALLAAAMLWSPAGQSPAASKPLVAGLPFTGLSEDEATARLARGLTQELITDLGRFPEFHVLAYDTSRPIAAAVIGAVPAGRRLKAGFVVDGSIQREGERVRITARLIDIASAETLWTGRRDRPAGDLFTIQEEISTTVANRLGGGAGLIRETGRIAAHRKPPASLSAYEYYLLGTEKLEQVNREDLEEALRLLSRSVEIDPGFARAWVELFHTPSLLPNYGQTGRATCVWPMRWQTGRCRSTRPMPKRMPSRR